MNVRRWREDGVQRLARLLMRLRVVSPRSAGQMRPCACACCERRANRRRMHRSSVTGLRTHDSFSWDLPNHHNHTRAQQRWRTHITAKIEWLVSLGSTRIWGADLLARFRARPGLASCTARDLREKPASYLRARSRARPPNANSEPCRTKASDWWLTRARGCAEVD